MCVIQSLCQVLEASVNMGSRVLETQMDSLLTTLHQQVKQLFFSPSFACATHSVALSNLGYFSVCSSYWDFSEMEQDFTDFSCLTHTAPACVDLPNLFIVQYLSSDHLTGSKEKLKKTWVEMMWCLDLSV